MKSVLFSGCCSNTRLERKSGRATELRRLGARQEPRHGFKRIARKCQFPNCMGLGSRRVKLYGVMQSSVRFSHG